MTETHLNKTKVLIGTAEIPTDQISMPVYNHLYGGNAPSYSEYMTQMIAWNFCVKEMQ
jgi:hypothetical protein